MLSKLKTLGLWLVAVSAMLFGLFAFRNRQVTAVQEKQELQAKEKSDEVKAEVSQVETMTAGIVELQEKAKADAQPVPVVQSSNIDAAVEEWNK